MNIGAVIKKLRQERGMVQEQVAEYLNVSTQAVSRWETGSALPDITQVPALANLFNCTSDMLLGVDVAAAKERSEAICKQASELMFEKKHDEAEEMLRAALKEYPNSYVIMYHLAVVLFNSGRKWGSEAEKQALNEEIVVLCEKILAECTDDRIRYGSIQFLCLTYTAMGENEKAVSLAEKMPETATSKGTLLTYILKGTKRYRHRQEQIALNMLEALQDITLLNSYPLDDGTYPYSLDECIALNQKALDIIDILAEKGDYGDFNWLLADTHMYLASLSKNGVIATALNHFKLAAKHAILHDTLQSATPAAYDDRSEEYTSLLFRGKKCPIRKSLSEHSKSKDLLDRSREFESLLPIYALEEIRDELRKYAV